MDKPDKTAKTTNDDGREELEYMLIVQIVQAAFLYATTIGRIDYVSKVLEETEAFLKSLNKKEKEEFEQIKTELLKQKVDGFNEMVKKIEDLSKTLEQPKVQSVTSEQSESVAATTVPAEPKVEEQAPVPQVPVQAPAAQTPPTEVPAAEQQQ